MNEQTTIQFDSSKLFGISQALRVQGDEVSRAHDLHTKAGEAQNSPLTDARELHSKASEVQPR